MAKKANGRMINVDISFSTKIASLSPKALSLFCLLIPHFNAHGKMIGNPQYIKGLVCPLIEWLTLSEIEKCLKEITQKTNIKWWEEKKGLFYLQSLNWSEHQELRPERLGPDRFPDYPGVIPETPGPLPLEGKEEGKGKDKEEGKEEDKSFSPHKEIIDYLNQKLKSRYTVSDTNIRLINGRLAEGFTVGDLKQVIDNTYLKWRGDPKMEPYLRPVTIFAKEKFEGYLNMQVDKSSTINNEKGKGDYAGDFPDGSVNW